MFHFKQRLWCLCIETLIEKPPPLPPPQLNRTNQSVFWWILCSGGWIPCYFLALLKIWLKMEKSEIPSWNGGTNVIIVNSAWFHENVIYLKFKKFSSLLAYISLFSFSWVKKEQIKIENVQLLWTEGEGGVC